MPEEQRQSLSWVDTTKVLGGVVLALLQAALVWIASSVTDEIKAANKSINQLNVNVAVLIADGNNQKSEISELKSRVSDLEKRKR